MEFLNWYLIRRIGLVMGINYIMVSQNLHSQILLTNNFVDIDKTAKNKIESPILGVYTLHSKGGLRLYSNDAALDSRNDISFVSERGVSGVIHNIKKVNSSELRIDIQNNIIVPGELIDNLNENPIYAYSGKFNSVNSTHNNTKIGILFRKGTVISNDQTKRGYHIMFGSKTYLIDNYKSMEGIHFECRDAKTNKKLTHFYYYLAYEIE